jgi:hypothetical protein
VRQPTKERRFDRLALGRREHHQRRAQQFALLAKLEHVARVGSSLGLLLLDVAAITALLSAVEA